jgi:hypothetical protein
MSQSERATNYPGANPAASPSSAIILHGNRDARDCSRVGFQFANRVHHLNSGESKLDLNWLARASAAWERSSWTASQMANQTVITVGILLCRSFSLGRSQGGALFP